MKFQNLILNIEQTHERTDAQTSPKQYAPSTFSKVGGIMINKERNTNVH